MAEEKLRVTAFTRVMVHHPGKVMLLTGILSLVLATIGMVVGNPELAASFSVKSDPLVERLDAFLQAREDLVSDEDAVSERADSLSQINVFFKSKSGDVFSQANLESIAEAQAVVAEMNGMSDVCQLVYDGDTALGCLSVSSPLTVATDGECADPTEDDCGYPAAPECQLVDQQYAGQDWPLAADADVRAALFDVCNASAVAADEPCEFVLYNYQRLMFDVGATCESATEVAGTYTRFIQYLGGPLEGFDNVNDRVEVQWDELSVKLEDMEAVSKLMDLVDDIQDGNSDLEVYWYSFALDITSYYLAQDMMFVLGSIVVVLILLWRGTGSLFLASCGLYEILISFPISYAFYLVFFGNEFVTVLSYLSIFLILGIGCDDVFVFDTAWKQSACEPALADDMELRFQWAYNRAAHAMLITSVTTCAAFLMLSLNPIWDVSCFGTILALMVAADFALVITWYPASVVFYEKHLARRFNSCLTKCGCKCLVPPAKEYADGEKEKAAAPAEAPEPHDPVSQMRRSERFFNGPFWTNVVRFRWAIVAFTAALLAGTTTAWVLGLEPATEEPFFFDKDHFVTKSDLIRQNEFEKSATDMPVQTWFVWGIDHDEAIDRDGVHPASDGDRGKVNYDGVDLSDGDAQTQLVDVCDAVLAEAVADGMAPAQDGTYCFMYDFKRWRELRGEPFPVVDGTIVSALADWRDSDEPSGMLNRTAYLPGYDSATGFGLSSDESAVSFMWVGWNTTMPLRSIALNELEPIFDDWERLVDVAHAAAPALPAPYSANFFWDWYKTQETLLSSATSNVLWSVIIAAVMLLISTRNWALVSLCVLSLYVIISMTFALMVGFGWQINVLEAICISVSTGLAVDFTVHIAHAYNEARGSRADRLRASLTTMGVSVLQGAFTTLAACSPLLGCQLLWFSSFGEFVLMLCGSAIFVALCLLTGVLAAVGPEGSFGVIDVKRIREAMGGGRESVGVAAGASGAGVASSEVEMSSVAGP